MIQVGDLVSPSGMALLGVHVMIKGYFSVSEQEYLAQERGGGPSRWTKSWNSRSAGWQPVPSPGTFSWWTAVDVEPARCEWPPLFPNPRQCAAAGQYARVRRRPECTGTRRWFRSAR